MEKEGLCGVCGQMNCKKHTFLFQGVKKISEFSGSSPPEIFVGRYNYPNVNIGILSPQEKGNTEIYSSQEIWHQNRLKMPEIMNLRSRLIYGRTKSNIRKVLEKTRFISTMQEIAMTSKSIGAEFKLKKPIIEKNREKDSYSPIISNAALVRSVRLEENPAIPMKIEYLANDTDVKSQTAILELEKSKIPTSAIIKILSAGLLGLGTNRKLVPTRWAITAVDDTLSKEKLKKIKHYPEINDIRLFTAEYLGNHYEFLLLPDRFSFEVIEINNNHPENSWHDYEGAFGRKNYAESVTGAYYANRLALCEYLEKIQRQCSCIVFREIGSEYTQSMGVGILRQISREAFSKTFESFSSISEALNKIQSRIKLNVSIFSGKSVILSEYGKQKRLENWLKEN